MKWRLFLLMVVLGFLGWWGLVGIQRQFGVGDYATSPQTFHLVRGRKAIVAGGRGILTYIDRGRRTVLIGVRCAGERRNTELFEGTLSEEVCGFTVRWLGGSALPEAPPDSQSFEVSWRSEPAPPGS